MHERPIGDLVDALRSSARRSITSACLAFRHCIFIRSTPAGDRTSVRGNVSSQFLTGLLMALPLRQRTTTIEVIGELISKPYIGITLAMLRRFGVDVAQDGWATFHGGGRCALPQPG